MPIDSSQDLEIFLTNCSAILFDLDGTLFDLNVPWMEVKQKINHHYTRTYGQSLPDTSRFSLMFNYIRNQQGSKAIEYYHRLLRDNELIAIKERRTKPKWLINEGLNKIASKIRFDTFFGIISSNFHESILEILKNYGLTDRFKVIIGRNDVNNMKPHPEGLIHVLNSYELDPQRVIFIGDQPTDEEAAQRAQIRYMDVKQFENLLKNI